MIVQFISCPNETLGLIVDALRQILVSYQVAFFMKDYDSMRRHVEFDIDEYLNGQIENLQITSYWFDISPHRERDRVEIQIRYTVTGIDEEQNFRYCIYAKTV